MDIHSLSKKANLPLKAAFLRAHVPVALSPFACDPALIWQLSSWRWAAALGAARARGRCTGAGPSLSEGRGSANRTRSHSPAVPQDRDVSHSSLWCSSDLGWKTRCLQTPRKGTLQAKKQTGKATWLFRKSKEGKFYPQPFAKRWSDSHS